MRTVRGRFRARSAAFVIVLGSVATVAPDAPLARAATVDVMAWAPSWEASDALTSWNARPGFFTELTPFFWRAAGASSIIVNADLGSANRIAEYKNAAAAAGKPIVATIVDGMATGSMANILADPTIRGLHVAKLVDFAVTEGFSGIDIDYEKFAFNDPRSSWPSTYTNWGLFMQELGTALHAAGKTLAVAVPPIYDNGQTSASGYWVYNFPAMAQWVDRIRIMTYSYSGNAGGPIAPFEWVRNSIEAALAVPGMVPGKVVMGIAAYGNDVITKVEGSCPASVTSQNELRRKSITAALAPAHAARKGAVPRWGDPRVNVITAPGSTDPVEKVYEYVDSFGGLDVTGANVRCNIYRKVWYSEADAIYRRVLLAQELGVAGVALWALGYDDPATWEGIAAAQQGNGSWQAPSPLPVNVQAPAVVAPYPTPIYSAGPLPGRFLDTRSGQRTADGLFQGVGRRDANSTIEVPIAGRGTVPAGTESVSLNVTVIGDVAGFVTVYPCDAPRPLTSNLNVRPGQPVSNSVITKLSVTGTVCLYTQTPAHLLVDVFNVLPASTLNPLPNPVRLLDTRPGEVTIDGQFAGAGAFGVGAIVEVPIAGRGGVPVGAGSAVLNVTSVGSTVAGFLTLWPCDGQRPPTSNVNFAPGAIAPNAVVTKLSATGTVCVFASNPTHVVIDAFATLAGTAFDALAAPVRLLDTRSGFATSDGAYAAVGKQAQAAILEVPIAGRSGIDGDAEAVILNITVDAPEAAGYVTVYPCVTARPLVSNVNFAPLQTLPNLLVTKLSPTGTVCIYSHVRTHVVIDAFGTLDL